MKKIILTVLLVFTGLVSCKEDFLSVIPETSLSSAIFFNKEADFQQAVNGAYVPLRSIYNDRNWLLCEMHSDNTYYSRNILFGATEQQEDIADFSVPEAKGLTANVHVLNQYRLDYQIIARANQVLALIDGVQFDAVRKNNIKGQAQYLRAFAYFQLVQLFGKVPMHTEPVKDREGSTKPLSTSDQLYAQIIKDATEAIAGLLPKTTQEPGRATKGAAQMLLANVYMVQKKWAQAEALLKEIVASGHYSLMPSYDDAFTTTSGNKNNKESVFEVQYQEGANGLQGNFMYSFLSRPMSPAELTPLAGTSNPQPLTGEGNNTPTPDVIAAYETGDLRKDASVGYVTLSGSLRSNKVYPYIKKFVRPHSLHNNHGMNWPVYRYSEVLLFLAEAQMEQNKLADAAANLNLVRTRAGLANTTATSQTALRDQIYQDRRSELAFENKRWLDLVRTGKAIETITAYGNRVKANPLDYYYPEGATTRSNAFTNIQLLYALPDVESSLTPHF
jgi:predicted negative regulator of RcsB-dependent stress response